MYVTVETITHEGTIAAGETFSIDVTVDAINAINMIELILSYDDSVMAAVGGDISGFLTDASFTSGMNGMTPGEVFIGGMSLENVTLTAPEVIATIEFEALVDIDADQLIEVIKAEAAMSPTVMLEVEATNGGIVIEEEVIEPTTTTTEAEETTTTAAEVTTTEAPAEVTTTMTASQGGSAQTGDTTNTIAFILMAVLAAAVVTGSVVLKKKAVR